jgi:hypothetical protein
VRAMAAWASWRLCDPERFRELKTRHLETETDPLVRAEWDRA